MNEKNGDFNYNYLYCIIYDIYSLIREEGLNLTCKTINLLTQ